MREMLDKEGFRKVWSTIKSKFAALARVAITGSYNDLSDTPGAATQSAAGLLSAEDKKKLDNMGENADGYKHPVYTALTGVPAANQTPGFGDTFDVTQPTSDETGHVTGMTSRKVTIPANTASTSKAGLMSSADKAKVDGIEAGANKYTHPAYTARTGAPTADQTPSFGGSFNVTQPVCDATGHITGMNSRKITMPSAAATASAAGLMPATDKAKLNNTNIAYGTCTTAAATAAKVVTISGNTNWTLTAGSIIIVKFSYTNTASNVTLNVKGTGAKSIWWNTAVYTGNSNIVGGAANRYTKFMYDGTYWVWLGHSTDSNTWTAASATVAGYVSTGTQTFAGAKTFNGVVKVAGATNSATSQVRNIAAGTAEATTALCPNGALYGQYE